METSVTKRGRQTNVPADPIAALRGAGKGEKLLERLLASRRADRPEFERLGEMKPENPDSASLPARMGRG